MRSCKTKSIQIKYLPDEDEICEIASEAGIAVSLATVIKKSLDNDTEISDVWALACVLEERLKDLQHKLNQITEL